MHSNTNNSEDFEVVLNILLESFGNEQAVHALLQKYPQYKEKLTHYIEIGKSVQKHAYTVAPNNTLIQKLISRIKERENVLVRNQQRTKLFSSEEFFRSLFYQFHWTKIIPVGVVVLLFVVVGIYQFSGTAPWRLLLQRARYSENNGENTAKSLSLPVISSDDSISQAAPKQIVIKTGALPDTLHTPAVNIATSLDVKSIQTEGSFHSIEAALDDYVVSEIKTNEFDQALLELQ